MIDTALPLDSVTASIPSVLLDVFVSLMKPARKVNMMAYDRYEFAIVSRSIGGVSMRNPKIMHLLAPNRSVKMPPVYANKIPTSPTMEYIVPMLSSFIDRGWSERTSEISG
jgi:hypothetical protein